MASNVLVRQSVLVDEFVQEDSAATLVDRNDRRGIVRISPVQSDSYQLIPSKVRGDAQSITGLLTLHLIPDLVAGFLLWRHQCVERDDTHDVASKVTVDAPSLGGLIRSIPQRQPRVQRVMEDEGRLDLILARQERERVASQPLHGLALIVGDFVDSPRSPIHHRLVRSVRRLVTSNGGHVRRDGHRSRPTILAGGQLHREHRIPDQQPVNVGPQLVDERVGCLGIVGHVT